MKSGLDGIEDVREAGRCIEKARMRFVKDTKFDDEERRLRAPRVKSEERARDASEIKSIKS